MTDPRDAAQLGYATNMDLTSPPIQGRARGVRISMICVLVLSVIVAGLLFTVPTIREMSKTPSPANAGFLIVVGLSLVVGGCGQMAAFITTVVFFCMWIHRANRLTRRFSPEGMQYTPGWAVGWFFIPFANLVMPYKVMSEIWQRNGQAPGEMGPPSNGLVGAWWLCYVLSGVTDRIASTLEREEIGAFAAGAVMHSLWAVLIVVSGVLCLQLVKRITENLESKRKELDGVPSHVPGTFPVQ